MSPAPRVDHFVILADMRTGSNLLEELLSARFEVATHGELFNPGFIGKLGRGKVLGRDMKERDSDPIGFLRHVVSASGELPGFRLFPGHDPRILDHVLRDPACAKIVLRRNPLESFLSWKIAQETGRWQLRGDAPAPEKQTRFEPKAFEGFLKRREAFLAAIRRMLAKTGQAAFEIDYDDLDTPEVLTGLGRFLGIAERREPRRIERRAQNPGPVSAKVTNPDEMRAALSRLDLFGLDRSPMSEPERGPNVRRWLVFEPLSLIFAPVPGVRSDGVVDALQKAAEADPFTGMTQGEMRRWKRAHPGHRTVTMVEHPLARAYAALCDHVLQEGSGSFEAIRLAIQRDFGLGRGRAVGPVEQRRADLLAFLKFLKANLSGRTAQRVPAVWASQDALVSGMAAVSMPDLILRADPIEAASNTLSGLLGRGPLPTVAPPAEGEIPLAALLDAEIALAARAAFRRDYACFGFSDLTG